MKFWKWVYLTLGAVLVVLSPFETGGVIVHWITSMGTFGYGVCLGMELVKENASRRAELIERVQTALQRSETERHF